jgi:fumarate hydratase class II
MRIEYDSIGEIKVENKNLWGAQTQRSLLHFSIGDDKIPYEIIKSFAIFKKAAAITNNKLKLLDSKKEKIIKKVCDEIIHGKLKNEFPLYVWQTGSGTQTNMNINEVISNRSIQILKGKIGSKYPIHPNDDVNKSQSSNDTFMTASHIAIIKLINEELIPNIEYMLKGLKKKKKEFDNIIKIGRTHLQDATPLTFGQEFSGYISLIKTSLEHIKMSRHNLYYLAAGGTAVGTGINTHAKFGKMVAEEISLLTKYPFKTAPNKFAALSSHDALVTCSFALKSLAINIMKIANDFRWLASGPRTGLNEIILPQNEPGSSIMPGKINPTQCEAATMVSIQVISNDVAVSMANSQGNFELNAFKPLMANSVIHSIKLLKDVCHNLTKFLILGIKINRKKVDSYVNNSLMLVTVLSPHIGYEKCAKLAEYAYKNDLTLKEANKKLNFLSENDFDKYLNLQKMIHPNL